MKKIEQNRKNVILYSSTLKPKGEGAWPRFPPPPGYGPVYITKIPNL